MVVRSVVVRRIAYFLLSFSLAPFARSEVKQEASLVQSGFYQYSLPVDEGGGAEKLLLEENGDLSRPIPFASGALTDGRLEGAGSGVGWRGKQGAATRFGIVFDLAQDHRLEKIEVLAKAANKFWNIREIEVYVRDGKSEYFRLAAHKPWTHNEPLVVALDGLPVRYVRINLSRLHSFVNVPLNEVKFYRDKNQVAEMVTNLSAEDMTAEFARDARLVDRYGQFLYENWPGKVTSDAQLAADAQQEDRNLPLVSNSRAGFDAHGGWKTGPKLTATGYYRLEKVDGRWWLVTPQGRLFFVIGMDGVTYHEGGYATPVLDKDGTERGAFEELPDRDKFGAAYFHSNGQEMVNFVTANLIRKYGPEFEQRWVDITARRLQDWGFNTHSKWTRDDRIRLPYITVLRPAASARKILWAPDPFDPEWEMNVERGVTTFLTENRENPWIVGHTFENERGWDKNVIEAMLKMGAESPAKAAFIEFLLGKHNNDVAVVSEKLGIAATSAEELCATPVAKLPGALAGEAAEFIEQASRRYHEPVARVLKRLDPNHLYLGGSLVPTWRNCPEWIAGSVDYLDGLSFDVYERDPSWLAQYTKYDKPILLLEFSFSVFARGLRAHSAASSVPDHKARGLHYRHYVEQLAANPVFVGFGFFIYYDQPATRRADGESYNMGILNQVDQPYEEMVEEVRKTNRRVYDIHAGKLPPVGAEILPQP